VRGRASRHVKIVCCPDSLKGVLPARDAAAALASGVRRAGIEADELPLADGGEGTAEALAAALGGRWRETEVEDPLGRRVEARYLELPERRAVVESAEAIGLWRLAPGELNPMRASSAGLGQLMQAAARNGAREILVTLGGSSTVDGGAGVRTALGPDGLPGVKLRVACDVRNPLLGERGAARAFGPQKGASPAQVDELERRLAAMPELTPFAALPGAGAAGGLGAALAALGAELTPGIELVLEAVGFAEHLNGARLAVTGEGRVDATSAEGKVPAGVAAACARAGVPCAVFGGVVAGGVEALYRIGVTSVVPLSGKRSNAREDLVALGEALGRLVQAFA
jgi:glycerate 2-kinase